MPYYAWRNKATGEVIEVVRPIKDASVPPDEEHEWERVYAFGVGRIEGGGGSPPRTSVVKRNG